MSNLKYIEDGEKNTWKTPGETDKDGGGDCEDLSIHKYHQLKAEGKDPYMVWGTIKRPNHDEQSHMWIQDGDDVIDIIEGDRTEQIRFNDKEFIKPDGVKGDAMRIRKWKDVNGRMG